MRNELAALLLLVVAWLVGCHSLRSFIGHASCEQRYVVDIVAGFGMVIGMTSGLTFVRGRVV